MKQATQKTADGQQENKEIIKFRRFAIFASVSLAAMAAVLLTELYLVDSLEREIYVAIALIIAALSAVVAAVFYVSMLYERILRTAKRR